MALTSLLINIYLLVARTNAVYCWLQWQTADSMFIPFKKTLLGLESHDTHAPSHPGINSDTLASNHCPGGARSSSIKTRLSTSTLLAVVAHIERSCFKVRYSDFQRRQNILCTTRILYQWSVSDSLTNASSNGSTSTLSGRPTKKWSGVSASKSFGSDDKG